MNQPKTLPLAPGGPEFVKYTPRQQGPQWNSGASARIIQVQEAAVDPLEPPKHRITKASLCTCFTCYVSFFVGFYLSTGSKRCASLSVLFNAIYREMYGVRCKS